MTAWWDTHRKQLTMNITDLPAKSKSPNHERT